MIKKIKRFYSKIKERFIAQSKRQKNIIVFCLIIFLCLFLAFIISAIDLAVNGADEINGYAYFIGNTLFFHDASDAFMDFFNVNYFVQDMDPYIGSGSSYPPMVLLFAKIFQLIDGSAEIAEVVQVSVRGIISLLIYLSIFFVCAWLLLRVYLKRKDISLSCSVMLYCALICSAPMLFAIDRGNYLLYTLLFVGYFLLYYKSEKRWQRELSYISLAFAVSFKIYPAIFAFLLLDRKNWLGFIKCAFYSILLIILPMFAFEGGFSANLVCFLSNLLNFKSQGAGYYIEGVWYLNGYHNVVSLSGIVSILVSRISGMAVAELPATVSTVSNIVAYIMAIIAIAAVFMTKQKWIKVFLITSVMTFVLNTNYEYNLIFFIFPLLMFLTEDISVQEEPFSKANKTFYIVCGVLLTLIFIPLPMGYLIPKYSHSLQHGYPVLNLVQVIAYLSLTVIIIIKTIKEVKEKHCFKSNDGNKEKEVSTEQT